MEEWDRHVLEAVVAVVVPHSCRISSGHGDMVVVVIGEALEMAVGNEMVADMEEVAVDTDDIEEEEEEAATEAAVVMGDVSCVCASLYIILVLR